MLSGYSDIQRYWRGAPGKPPFVSRLSLQWYNCHTRISGLISPSQADLQSRGYDMANGIIKRLMAERGFGFIQTSESKDIFFHHSGLQGVQFAMLREGQEV